MAEQVRSFYDELAADYHLIFADWNDSITRQAAVIGPCIEREAGESGNLRILDCACGIGTQALGLAQRGHRITGCDLSPAAIDRARCEAFDRGLDISFMVADMLNLSSILESDFDVAVCLDNSLPHLESYEQLCQAAIEIRTKLRNGGVFMASIRDYDLLVREKAPVQGPNFYLDQGERRIVHQVWDWIDDLRYTFHLYITRQVSTGWESHHYASIYRALLRNELTSAIHTAGFVDANWMFPSETGFYQPILIAKKRE